MRKGRRQIETVSASMADNIQHLSTTNQAAPTGLGHVVRSMDRAEMSVDPTVPTRVPYVKKGERY